MKKILLSILTAIFVLLAVILVRAWLHQPQGITDVPVVNIPLDEQAIAGRLAQAVRFQTVSHQDPTRLDITQFNGFISWIAASYPEFHSTLTLETPGDYTLLYRWQGSNPDLQPILLTAHYDVVPVIPGTEARWQHPPWAGVIEDGVIWGRGALDDKSGVIGQLEAASALIRQGFVPVRTVYFSFGHDEELGGSNGAAAVAALLADRNEQLAWSLDEGSFLFDGMLPGVDELMATINVAEKGGLTLQIVAKADGGHSSMPPRETAVGILAGAITALEANPVPGGLSGLSNELFDTASRYMPFSFKILFANRWLFDGIIDDQLSAITFANAMLRTTTAPTMLSGSVKVNVLPIEAIATVNFRLHPRDSVEDVVKHVQSVVASDQVEVRSPWGGRPASDVSDWNSAGYNAVAQAIREVYGEVVITPGLMIAGSDTRHYGKVADNAFRFNPMVVTPDDLTGFHGTNEKISVKNLAQGVRTYMQILRHGAGSG